MRGALVAASSAVVAMATVGLTTPHAAATDSCRQDGLANLCVSSQAAPNGLSVNYRVTQLDGPGAYSIYYVNDATNAMSTPLALAPIAYQSSASGSFSVSANTCYTVNLNSTAGTYIVVDTVCG